MRLAVVNSILMTVESITMPYLIPDLLYVLLTIEKFNLYGSTDSIANKHYSILEAKCKH